MDDKLLQLAPSILAQFPSLKGLKPEELADMASSGYNYRYSQQLLDRFNKQYKEAGIQRSFDPIKNPQDRLLITGHLAENADTDWRHAKIGYSKKLMNDIMRASEKYKIDPSNFIGVMRHESGGGVDENGDELFHPYAKNETSSARGLGQFIDGIWNSMVKADPKLRYSPSHMINAIAQHLAATGYGGYAGTPEGGASLSRMVENSKGITAKWLKRHQEELAQEQAEMAKTVKPVTPQKPVVNTAGIPQLRMNETPEEDPILAMFRKKADEAAAKKSGAKDKGVAALSGNTNAKTAENFWDPKNLIKQSTPANIWEADPNAVYLPKYDGPLGAFGGTLSHLFHSPEAANLSQDISKTGEDIGRFLTSPERWIPGAEAAASGIEDAIRRALSGRIEEPRYEGPEKGIFNFASDAAAVGEQAVNAGIAPVKGLLGTSEITPKAIWDIIKRNVSNISTDWNAEDWPEEDRKTAKFTGADLSEALDNYSKTTLDVMNAPVEWRDPKSEANWQVLSRLAGHGAESLKKTIEDTVPDDSILKPIAGLGADIVPSALTMLYPTIGDYAMGKIFNTPWVNKHAENMDIAKQAHDAAEADLDRIEWHKAIDKTNKTDTTEVGKPANRPAETAETAELGEVDKTQIASEVPKLKQETESTIGEATANLSEAQDLKGAEDNTFVLTRNNEIIIYGKTKDGKPLPFDSAKEAAASLRGLENRVLSGLDTVAKNSPEYTNLAALKKELFGPDSEPLYNVARSPVTGKYVIARSEAPGLKAEVPPEKVAVREAKGLDKPKESEAPKPVSEPETLPEKSRWSIEEPEKGPSNGKALVDKINRHKTTFRALQPFFDAEGNVILRPKDSPAKEGETTPINGEFYETPKEAQRVRDTTPGFQSGTEIRRYGEEDPVYYISKQFDQPSGGKTGKIDSSKSESESTSTPRQGGRAKPTLAEALSNPYSRRQARKTMGELGLNAEDYSIKPDTDNPGKYRIMQRSMAGRDIYPTKAAAQEAASGNEFENLVPVEKKLGEWTLEKASDTELPPVKDRPATILYDSEADARRALRQRGLNESRHAPHEVGGGKWRIGPLTREEMRALEVEPPIPSHTERAVEGVSATTREIAKSGEEELHGRSRARAKKKAVEAQPTEQSNSVAKRNVVEESTEKLQGRAKSKAKKAAEAEELPTAEDVVQNKTIEDEISTAPENKTRRKVVPSKEEKPTTSTEEKPAPPPERRNLIAERAKAKEKARREEMKRLMDEEGMDAYDAMDQVEAGRLSDDILERIEEEKAYGRKGRSSSDDQSEEFLSLGEEAESETTPKMDFEGVKKILAGRNVEVTQAPEGHIELTFPGSKKVELHLVSEITDSGNTLNRSIEKNYGKSHLGRKAMALYHDGKVYWVNRDPKGLARLDHELIHWAEDVGLITPEEIKALDERIKRDTDSGKWTSNLKSDVEKRAHFITDHIERRRSAGFVNRVITKIRDLLDSITHFGRVSTNKVIKEAVSGKLFERGEKRTPNPNELTYALNRSDFHSRLNNYVMTQGPNTATAANWLQDLRKATEKGKFSSEELEWSNIIQILEAITDPKERLSRESIIAANKLAESITFKNLTGESTIKDSWNDYTNDSTIKVHGGTVFVRTSDGVFDLGRAKFKLSGERGIAIDAIERETQNKFSYDLDELNNPVKPVYFEDNEVYIEREHIGEISLKDGKLKLLENNGDVSSFDTPEQFFLHLGDLRFDRAPYRDLRVGHEKATDYSVTALTMPGKKLPTHPGFPDETIFEIRTDVRNYGNKKYLHISEIQSDPHQKSKGWYHDNPQEGMANSFGILRNSKYISPEGTGKSGKSGYYEVELVYSNGELAPNTLEVYPRDSKSVGEYLDRVINPKEYLVTVKDPEKIELRKLTDEEKVSVGGPAAIKDSRVKYGLTIDGKFIGIGETSARARSAAISRIIDPAIPTIPFRNSYAILGIKKSIIDGVKKNVDRITWENSEDLAKLYFEDTSQAPMFERLYGVYLPHETNKLVKRFGSEVKTFDVGGRKLFGFEITDKMRGMVEKEGLPLLSLDDAKKLTKEEIERIAKGQYVDFDYAPALNVKAAEEGVSPQKMLQNKGMSEKKASEAVDTIYDNYLAKSNKVVQRDAELTNIPDHPVSKYFAENEQGIKEIDKTRKTVWDRIVEAVADDNYVRTKQLKKLGPAADPILNALTVKKGSSAQAAEWYADMHRNVFAGLGDNQTKLLNQLIHTERVKSLGEGGFDQKYVKEMSFKDAADYVDNFEEINGLTSEEGANIRGRSKKFFQYFKDILKTMEDEGLISAKERERLEQYNYARREAYNHFLDEIDHASEVTNPNGRTIKVLDSGIDFLQQGEAKERLVTDQTTFAKYVFAKISGRIFDNRVAKEMFNLASTQPDNPLVRVLKEGEKANKYESEIQVFQNGEPVKMAVEAKFARLWKEEPRDISARTANAIRVLSGSALLRPFITGSLAPTFSVTNLPIDIMTSYMNTTIRSKSGKKESLFSPAIPVAIGQYAKHMANVAGDAFTRKGLFDDFIKYGGGNDFLTDQGRLWRDSHINERLDTTRRVMSYANNTSEIWMRLAVTDKAMHYISKREGISLAQVRANPRFMTEAVATARKYLDFGVHGYAGKYLDQALPYTNAGAQATRALFTSIVEDKGAFAWKAAQLIGIGIAAKLFYETMDDDYRDGIGQYNFENSFVYPGPAWLERRGHGGKIEHPFVVIRKDPAVKILTHIGSMIVDAANGKEVNPAKEAVKMIDWLSPMQLENIPPIMAAWQALIHNVDSRTGRKLWYREKTPIDKQAYVDTPEIFVNMAQGFKKTGLDISPEALRVATSKLVGNSSELMLGFMTIYDEVFSTMPESLKERAGQEFWKKMGDLSSRRLIRYTRKKGDKRLERPANQF